MDDRQINYVTQCDAPFEHVAVDPIDAPFCPEPLRDRVVIDTVHDGNYIPARLLTSPRICRLQEDGTLWRHYVQERDWGANRIAAHLARCLGLSGYDRVNVARVVMDFNRFPGSTPGDVDPLDRLAINPPFAQHLTFEEKQHVLETYYDAVSRGMESALDRRLVKLSIHTYDERNKSLTRRPEVSLLTRSLSYQRHSRLPFGLFDPMFPAILAECCASRILRDRLALTLEKDRVIVEHNYPYCLPDGSLEIRSQTWFFFHHLRQVYEAEYPNTHDDEGHELVWEMLFNTNLRNTEAEALYGYLHRFRRATDGNDARFSQAREAYEAITHFLDGHPTLVNDYRMSRDRPSSISIEVRKDLLWRFDGATPTVPIPHRAEAITEKIAEGLGTWLNEDRS